MKKSILNLKGAQELSKNEQKKVSGGKPVMLIECRCPDSGLHLGTTTSWTECRSWQLTQCSW